MHAGVATGTAAATGMGSSGLLRGTTIGTKRSRAYPLGSRYSSYVHPEAPR